MTTSTPPTAAVVIVTGCNSGFGSVHPLVGREFDLADAPAALHDFEDRSALGKIVLTLAGDAA